MVRVLVVVCARNEAIHIERCLRDWIAAGCEVCLIDNESIDETVALASPYLSHGLLSIERLPWKGAFSMSDVLAAKRAVVEASMHDWVVHADPDERHVSPVKGETVYDAISTADAAGYNVINFHECAFIPRAGEDFYRTDYADHMRDYYFFQPSYPRLNRAWKRAANLDNTTSGGHLLQGAGLRRSPVDLILRHYIVLSQEHAIAKYVGRVFAPEDLAKRWHGNRTVITHDNIRLRSHPAMRRLAAPQDDDWFDLSQPVATHFWQWPV